MMNGEAIEQVKTLFPEGGATNAPEDLAVYGYDATGNESAPELVVFPTTARQVSAVLKLANKHLFPVTPRGAGTGFVGGSIPARHGVEMVMTRMNRTLEIDEENLTALVEPGVVTGKFQAEVEKLGLFYPPDPASLNTSTLGGNVAMCSGGPRAVKYGVTRDYVLGLEVVLPSGEIIQTGARPMKSVVGYDLTRLMTGSEGTLGVVTKITLRLIPKPETVRTLLAIFPDMKSAAKTVSSIIKRKIIPRTLEFMDKNALAAVARLGKTGLPAQGGALLLVETDGAPDVAERQIGIIREVCGKFNPSELKVASNEEEREEIWSARRSLSQAVRMIKPHKINEDITVPRSVIPDLLEKLEEISEKFETPIINFGHAGDGNIHVNVMTDKNNEDEYKRARRAVDEVFRVCLELGGTISGEHGIGLAKAKYIESEVGKTGVDIIRKIKSVFDPNNILNPGKITPEEG